MERCFGTGDPLYEHYHDTEWGRPLPDDPEASLLLERLVLEGFQSGTSMFRHFMIDERRRTSSNFSPSMA